MKKFDLGKKIKDLRNSKGISQDQLSGLAQLSLRTVQRIENGETEARGDTLKRLADALDIAPAELTAPVYHIDEKTVEDDRWTLALINFSALSFFIFPLLGVFAPLAILGLQKNKTKGINETGRRLINFQISWCAFLLFIISPFIFHFSFLRNLIISPENMIFSISGLYLLNSIFVVYNTIRSLNAKNVFYPLALPLVR